MTGFDETDETDGRTATLLSKHGGRGAALGGVLVSYDAGSSARMERATRRQLADEQLQALLACRNRTQRLRLVGTPDGKRKAIGLQALATALRTETVEAEQKLSTRPEQTAMQAGDEGHRP
jgi:hypothetical protein